MSTGRSSRVKMRSRPIDVNKALFIADTSQREPDEQEIEQALASLPGGGGHGGHGGHGHSGHTGQGDGMIAGVGIPTPPIFVDANYHTRLDYGKFVQPSCYIKAHQTAGTGLLNNLDHYDLLKEDMEWLAEYNAAAEAKRPPGPTMTEDDMENLIDLFEREAGKITLNGMRAEMMSLDDKIDPRKDFPMVRAILLAATLLGQRSSKTLEPVYEYWIDKRRRLGKALMRQYQEPPPRGNTDPHVAFRPRTEGRRISKRNPRKDDHSGYYKMGYLKRDFTKILDILESVTTREQLKREGALLSAHIFDARLAATPWAQKMLKENPAVGAAITQQQQTPAPPPTSVAAGAQPLPMPASLATATPETVRLFRLLTSSQPPCTYSRQELEAETRRRRSQNQSARAAAAAAAAAASNAAGGGGGGGSSSGQKRPNNVISIRRPDRASTGGSSGGSHGHSAESRAREKEARKAARREYALSLGGSLAPLEEEPEEMEVTDEEDLLSEDEEDAKFYAEVEAHVKRMRIERAGNSLANGTDEDGAPRPVKAEPHGPYVYASGGTSGAASAAPYQPGHTRPIPPGAKVGYLSGVVGRGNLIWLECTYQHLPPAQAQVHLAQQQQMQQAYAAQQAAHQQQRAQQAAAAAAAQQAAQQQQQQQAMHISVIPPPSSSASNAAVPMEIDRSTAAGSSMPSHSLAIKAQ